MEIKEITDKNIWEDFLRGCGEKTFLQSWNWGEFQQKMGNRIWRLGIYNAGDLAAICLVILIKAKRGTFLFVPHGPNIISNFQFLTCPVGSRRLSFGVSNEILNPKIQIIKTLLEKLKEMAKEEKADFIRIAPILENSQENEKIFIDLGFKQAPMHASTYEATLKLDITIPEEELLKNMRKTTRYLIRKAIHNRDISIEKRGGVRDIEAFQKLSKEISKRQKFISFSDDYIKNEFEVFARDSQALILFGRYKGEIAAGALVIFWSGIGFYHQAASLDKFANLSIPYLLQWEAIKEAKKRGCVLYDFWGYVNPKKEPKHPWAGPSLFKAGFGGYKKEYIKTEDLPLSFKYYFNYIIETIRRIKRGL